MCSFRSNVRWLRQCFGPVALFFFSVSLALSRIYISFGVYVSARGNVLQIATPIHHRAIGITYILQPAIPRKYFPLTHSIVSAVCPVCALVDVAW